MNFNIGDRITIYMSERDDEDLACWLQESEEDGFIEDGIYISDIDEDQHMCWVDGCPYGISLDIVATYDGVTDFLITE